MESLEKEIDSEYMENFDKLEKNYDKFYNTQVTNIKIFFIYIDEKNEIYNIKSDKEFVENGCITKERILYLIKKYQYNLLYRHKLVSLLQYNIDLHHTDLQNFILDKKTKSETDNYLTSFKILDNIKFKDTIPLLSDLNSIFFIYSYLSPKNQSHIPHNTTKRIIITDNSKSNTMNTNKNKNKKTRRKW